MWFIAFLIGWSIAFFFIYNFLWRGEPFDIKPIFLPILFIIVSLFAYQFFWKLTYPRVKKVGDDVPERKNILTKVVKRVSENKTLSTELQQKMREYNITPEEIKEFLGNGKGVDVGVSTSTKMVVERAYDNYLFFELPARHTLIHYIYIGAVVLIGVLIPLKPKVF